jgi:membrane protein
LLGISRLPTSIENSSFWAITKATFADWKEDKVPRLAAALAYYALFSIAPMLIIVIAIAGIFFGEEAARGQILGQVAGLVGERGAAAIQDIVVAASEHPKTGVLATVVGVGALLLGAAGLFGQLQDALNTIWEVETKANRSWKDVIRDRFAPFTMVLGIAFLLLTSLVVSAAVAALGKYLGGFMPGAETAMQAVTFVLSFAIVTLLFAMIYKILPDAKVAWSDVWIGAAATALLFTAGKLLIGLYLGRSSTTSAYGAAGSLVVVLLWVYYSAQILFLGAEFTQVYARARGAGIRPKENAKPATEEVRAQQGMRHKKGDVRDLRRRTKDRGASAGR